MKRGFLRWLAFVLLTAGVAAWVMDGYTSRVLVRAKTDRLEQQTALLGRWIEAAGPALDPQAMAESAAQASLSRVTLIDASGTVLGDSSQEREDLGGMDNHADRPEVAQARSGVTGWTIRQSSTTNVTYLYSARRLEGDGRVRFVRIAIPVPDRTRPYRPSFGAILLVATLFSALLAAYGYRRHRRLTEAIDRLRTAVETDRLPAADDLSESEPLTLAIARARQRSEERLAESQGALEVLTAAVAGMKEGLLLIDHGRRIQLANRSARQIFELEIEQVGLPVSQVVRHPAILESVERALVTGRAPDQTTLVLEGQERTFEIRVTPLDEERGVLVLLFDVSELRSLQQVRQNFVANVSHELRTPLTAIKAAAETILEERQDEDQPFAQMIQRNAEAMEDLVEELTDLSLIETGAVNLERTRFDLGQLVQEVVEQLRPVSGEKTLRSTVDEPLLIVADRRRLRQVLVNLIDNALKFNRPDGVVEIEGDADDQEVVLRVRDGGIGIPATHLETIFHRFHQVAGDRSRERPGFGLGLAIVKHLVRLHGGQIAVESELGVGSVFTLRLPVSETPFDLAD